MAERKQPELAPLVLGDSNGKESIATGQFLTVDETKRPRANSDPIGLHFAISILPEITVTADDADDTGSNEDDEVDNFLVPPPPRPRANTCPEDMFLQRRERPPTPPPSDIGKSPVNRKKRFNFSHNSKDFNGFSFIHHKLCKVNEDGGGFPSILNGHRRHSTGRRASCLAALSESNCLLEEENEDDISTPVSITLSHSMNALSLSSNSVQADKYSSKDGNDNGSPDDKNCPILIKCSVDMDNKDSENSKHLITSNSSVR